MTEVLREGREGSAPEMPAAPGEAECAQRARSVPQADSVAFQVVTQCARLLFRGGVSALSAGSLRDVSPPTLGETRAWHHRCAGHYQAGLIRWPRLAWGYVHVLVVKPALMAAEWVTASPARLAVAAAAGAVIWYWRP